VRPLEGELVTQPNGQELFEMVEKLFLDALGQLAAEYGSTTLYVERDLVHTVQSHLNEAAKQSTVLDLRVYNDYPMIPGTHRHLSTDLAILTPETRSSSLPSSCTNRAIGDTIC
jgi:hypothetical protein